MNICRTNEQLQAESKTLWYEFKQFCEVAALLRAGTFRENTTVHNALVESFAIHCRAISCFFFAHDKDLPSLIKDDLGADHYAPPWATHAGAPSAILVAAKKNCDKQVAHMTAARRDLNFEPDNQSSWAVTQIENNLRCALGIFLSKARSDLFAPEAWAALKTFCSAPLVQTSRQQPSPINLTAKTCPPDEAITDVRTIAPDSRMHGKTEE